MTANRIAVWNPGTGAWSSLGAGASNGVGGAVYALAVHDGKVYVAGGFTTAGGVTANRVAAWNPATQTWSSLGTGDANGIDGEDPYVSSLATHDGKVYVGGYFLYAGGATAICVAAWNPATGTWSRVGDGTPPVCSVSALAMLDGRGYAGADFLYGVPAYIASWSCPSGLAAQTALLPAAKPGGAEFVTAIAPPIQALIEAASDGAVIRLAPGTYTGAIRVAGKAITIESTDGAVATIIDGGRMVDTVISVVEGGYLHLRGVTVQGGVGGTAVRGVADTMVGVGGGVLVDAGHATIESCVIRGNSAVHGGGIAALDSVLELTDSSLGLNGASGRGGGLFVVRSRASVGGSRIVLNRAAFDGAIFSCSSSVVSIDGSELCWNEPIEAGFDERECGDCAADLNGDAVIDAHDLAVWFETWTGAGATDASRGRLPDVQSLDAVLAAWGSHCTD